MDRDVATSNGRTVDDTPPTRPSRQAVARHEAGHAVAAYWLKMDVSSLSIEPEGPTFGRIVLRTSRRMLERIDTGILSHHARRQVENQVMTLLAGGVAARDRAGCERDHALAAALVMKLSGSLDEAAAYAAWLRQRTTVLLGLVPSRIAVSAIADQLLRRGTLPGSAAHAVTHRSFLDVASGRRPG